MNVTRFLIACSSLLLGLGLIGPTLTIFPKAGDLTWFIKIIAPEELAVSTYSILGVIQKLFQTNDIFLAVILAIFSVFSPVLKLSFYWHATGLKNPKKFKSMLQVIHYIGKFSMAEVFALATCSTMIHRPVGSGCVAVSCPSIKRLVNAEITSAFQLAQKRLRCGRYLP